MTESLPQVHNYPQIASAVSDISNNLERQSQVGGLRKTFTLSGQIQRGEEYMDALSMTYHLCHPFMNDDDEELSRERYYRCVCMATR